MYLAYKRRVSLFDRRRGRGVTLIELLVTLAIMSILAAIAMPYTETVVTRTKEVELRRALREIRTAIDRFNDDYRAGRISRLSNGASENGFPRELRVLVDGIETVGTVGGKARYLRRIPPDPFAVKRGPENQQWVLRGYRDEPDALIWNGEDVYDIRSASERYALDGSQYARW